MRRRITALAAASAFAAGARCAPACTRSRSIESRSLRSSAPQHFMSQWLVKWSEKLEKGSDGRLVFKHFPGSQMAPTPQHYDLARTGQADVAWFLHGGTPGRFPLTELVQPALSWSAAPRSAPRC